MALTVEIKQLVNGLSKVSLYRTIIECITNALEANSQNIQVITHSSKREGTMYEDDWFIDRVDIVDDGDGFTEINFSAFKEYRTKNKIHLGCKGVGRLTWLKIFNKAEIESILKEDGRVIKKRFTFDENFDYSNKPQIEELPSDTKNFYTKVVLTEIKELDDSMPDDLERLKETVVTELLPKLLLNKRDFEIQLKSTRPGIPYVTIKNSDLPILKKIEFPIGTDSRSYNFILKYSLPEEAEFNITKPKSYSYYCANQRAVESFKSKGLTVNLSADERQYGIFLLESEYFDQRVDDARNEIKISEEELNGHLTWDHINDQLRQILKDIIYTKWPTLRKEGEEDKAHLAEENPHLSSYIKNFNIVGRIEKEEALKNAIKQFENKKKHVRKKYSELLVKHKAGIEDVHEFEILAENTTELGKQELAEYVWYRKVVIDIMQRLIDLKEPQEKVIHNLIMPMKTKDLEIIEDNNLWLLDDKFSLYQYAASDLEIKEIYEDVIREVYPEGQCASKDRPDLFIFFSDTANCTDDLEAVIIELKSFVSGKYDKGKGLDQLPLYAEAFKKNHPSFKVFWLYLVVDEIDDDFKRLLKFSRGYVPFYSHDGEIYMQYIKEANAHVTVMSAKTLNSNARARNHRFLKIVQNCSDMRNETSNHF